MCKNGDKISCIAHLMVFLEELDEWWKHSVKYE